MARESDSTGRLSESMRRVLSTGLGALFLTEESIKRYLSESKLPRDVGQFFSANAGKAKHDFLSVLAREAAQAFRERDLVADLERFLADKTVRLTLDIDFLPREKSPAQSRAKGSRRRQG